MYVHLDVRVLSSNTVAEIVLRLSFAKLIACRLAVMLWLPNERTKWKYQGEQAAPVESHGVLCLRSSASCQHASCSAGRLVDAHLTMPPGPRRRRSAPMRWRRSRAWPSA